MWRTLTCLAITGVTWLTFDSAAIALPTGLRPLGITAESARSVEPGHGMLEIGALLPQWDGAAVAISGPEDERIFERWRQLSAWPSLTVQVPFRELDALLVHVGPLVGAAYRMPLLYADAPWGNEYVRCVFQAGGGFHLASHRPGAHVRLPVIYEKDTWAFHVIPGGYYLFNDQPIADVQIGLEHRPWSFMQAGMGAHLRMDTKKITPQDGTWSFGAGLGIHVTEGLQVRAEWLMDNGLPEAPGANPAFQVEFPGQRLSVSLNVVW
jgi:hypothetical protein